MVIDSRGDWHGYAGTSGTGRRELAVWSKVVVGTEVELRLPAWSVYTIARRWSWIDRLRASDTTAHGDQEVS